MNVSDSKQFGINYGNLNSSNSYEGVTPTDYQVRARSNS